MGRYYSYRHRRYGRKFPLAGLALLLVAAIFGCMYGIVVAHRQVATALGQLFQGGVLNYNVETFQTYAQNQYDFYFSGVNEEDNLLIVILPREEGVYEFDYLMMAGDHVEEDLRDYLVEGVRVLGDPDTPLNQYSTFDSRLTNFVNNQFRRMQSQFSSREAVVDCREASFQSSVCFVNTTELELDGEMITQTMRACEEQLEIGMVVLVVDQDEVFDRYLPKESIWSLLTAAVVAIGLIVGLVFLLLYWKKHPLYNKPKNK